MKKSQDLINTLDKINQKGYKAYKYIEGKYEFSNYTLSIDHVQGDPFAIPSRIRVIVNQSKGKFPLEYFNENYKRVATIDFLNRLFYNNINKYYHRIAGSGKSGVLHIDYCGQEILDKTAIFINKDKIEARLEVGLPAQGRKILSREAKGIFINIIPKIVEKTLFFNNIDKDSLKRQIELIEDQTYLRNKLDGLGLCAFIANDSILPRENGISEKPLKNKVIKFKSPKTLEVEITLPNRGKIKGMGIPKGITLIIGGGYHGKSTLLKALELGVYNHIEGDGRELVITDDSAVKVRAEDGRHIEKVDISMFINNLPNKKDTMRFSSENASGSTSQATNIIEAIEENAKMLLIDEDTSATNFMIRDEIMQKIVSCDKEPITPFINRAKDLYYEKGISTVLVIGSSGDYFKIADTVIMMDGYKAIDVTEKVEKICNHNNLEQINNKDKIDINFNRVILKNTFKKSYGEVKIKAINKNTILYDKCEIDLRYVEQIIHQSQTNAIVEIIKYIKNNLVDEKQTLGETIDRIFNVINSEGLDSISFKKGKQGNLALPRKYEVMAALNRFRELNIK